MRKWNSACSLVSRRDAAHLEERHLRDSLELQEFMGSSRRLLDIGSGGGFPGVPLAIAVPELEVTCMERSHKKCRFLRHVQMTLKLDKLAIVEADVRNAHAMRERFDVVTIRAVAKPTTAWNLAKNMLNENGYALLQTAHQIEASILDNGVIDAVAPATRGWISVVKRSNPKS